MNKTLPKEKIWLFRFFFVLSALLVLSKASVSHVQAAEGPSILSPLAKEEGSNPLGKASEGKKYPNSPASEEKSSAEGKGPGSEDPGLSPKTPQGLALEPGPGEFGARESPAPEDKYSPFRELIQDILKVSEAIISGQLTVQGKAHFLDHTVLNNTTVTGDFSQGGTLFITDGEKIDNIAGDLRLQKDSLVISREGTISAKQKLELVDDSFSEEELEQIETADLSAIEGIATKVATSIENTLSKVRNLLEVKVANTLVAHLDNTGHFFARVLSGRRVETDVLTPLAGGDLAVRLGSKTSSEGSSDFSRDQERSSALARDPIAGKPATSKSSPPARLKILNAENTEVASIDSEGAGTFSKLNIREASAGNAGEEKRQALGISSEPASGESPASAEKLAGSIGSAAIPAGRLQILIRTTAITANSKVFVTPTSSTGGQIPYVLTKTAGSYFIVKIDQPLSNDLGFDWWVVN